MPHVNQSWVLLSQKYYVVLVEAILGMSNKQSFIQFNKYQHLESPYLRTISELCFVSKQHATYIELPAQDLSIAHIFNYQTYG